MGSAGLWNSLVSWWSYNTPVPKPVPMAGTAEWWRGWHQILLEHCGSSLLIEALVLAVPLVIIQVLCWRLKERMMRVSECHECVQDSANELELSPTDLGSVLDDSDSLETLRADSATDGTEPKPKSQPQTQHPAQAQPQTQLPAQPVDQPHPQPVRQRVR